MKIKSEYLLAVLAAMGLASSVSTVQAAVTIYSSYATWSTAVSAQTAITIPDPAPSQFIILGSGNVSVTYGGVSFSASSSFGNTSLLNVGTLWEGTPAPVLSDQSASQGIAINNILITLPSAAYAFSLNYCTFDGAAVTFTLGNGDTFTQASTGTGNYFEGLMYSTVDFAGATDTTAFQTILLTSSDNALNINHLVTANAVPEAASTVRLLCLALTGLISLRRKLA